MKISDIKPNPQNPRTIKDENFKKLVQSIKDFPEMLDARPLVLNKDNVILGGNMRFKASKEAGLKEVPVKIVDWSEEKQREFIIKDNISGGDWDWDQLANEWDVEQLDEWGLDVPDFAGDVEVEEDEAPEVSQEPPKSELGKVYQLGRHRVMCGDSTDKGSILLLMNGQTTELLLTDPPYGIAVNNDWQNKVHSDNQNYGKGKIMNDEGDLDLSILSTYPRRIVFGFPYLQDKEVEGWLVWDKEPGFKGRSLTSPIEMAYSTCWRGFRAIRLLWSGYMRGDKSEEKVGHPTQKPTRLLADLIKDNSEKGGSILDLFLGSGSTLIACEQTNRTCYGMELDPKYTDVIRKRYAKFVYPDRWEEEWESLTPEAV